MEDEAKKALNEILNILKSADAKQLVEEIEVIIARGKVEEVETTTKNKNKTKEFKQVALTADEAISVVTDMLVSSLEPVLMLDPIIEELTPDNKGTIEWAKDYVEDSLVNYNNDAEQEIKDFCELRENSALVRMHIETLKGAMNDKL
ncbi:TPA: hypothetical protein ACPVXA_004676 [Vibrio parahaemolyticus]|nr:hypothetical protein [Vibrio parahaemolyticus]HCG5919248.1 hypothetical protein [Vibrio parahaemolyticus]HCH2083846.1 hypothetical protein [Vibrio parahaemolyticus]